MIPSADVNIIMTCLRLIVIYLNKKAINLDDKGKYMFPHVVIMTYISYCCIWSLGANVHDSSRKTFQEILRTAIANVALPNAGKSDLPTDDIYEYTVDPQYDSFQNWDELKAEFKYNKNESFFNVLVPTADTVKYN